LVLPAPQNVGLRICRATRSAYDFTLPLFQAFLRQPANLTELARGR
jgi:hypothetical protein